MKEQIMEQGFAIFTKSAEDPGGHGGVCPADAHVVAATQSARAGTREIAPTSTHLYAE
jgi:hypothetical protein